MEIRKKKVLTDGQVIGVSEREKEKVREQAKITKEMFLAEHLRLQIKRTKFQGGTEDEGESKQEGGGREVYLQKEKDKIVKG